MVGCLTNSNTVASNDGDVVLNDGSNDRFIIPEASLRCASMM